MIESKTLNYYRFMVNYNKIYMNEKDFSKNFAERYEILTANIIRLQKQNTATIELQKLMKSNIKTSSLQSLLRRNRMSIRNTEDEIKTLKMMFKVFRHLDKNKSLEICGCSIEYDNYKGIYILQCIFIEWLVVICMI